MTSRVAIEFAPAEGALVRIVGLVERRGFLVRGVAMTDRDGRGTLTLDVEPRDAARSLDVLSLQVGRLHGVRSVSFVPPAAEAA